MLKRKIDADLIAWKNNPNKKALLVKGARQVGKTYSIDNFGRNNYESYIHLNFEKNPSAKEIFSGDRDVDTIMTNLSIRFPNIDPIPGKTLIFLDEIQACPDARVAFKFFTIDGRFDVIGSGSLLGLNYREVSSYPVGYEDLMEMHSLDFEEFLWASGIKDNVIGKIKNALAEKKPLDDFMLREMEDYYTRYMAIGGMPEVVNTFMETKHMGKVMETQKKIVSGYRDDVMKYAIGVDKNRINACLNSIPEQLASENKVFKYRNVEGNTNARYDMYGSSISWLYDANVINLCYNLSEPAIPLIAKRRGNVFKIYMRDTGLLVSMLGEAMMQSIMSGDTKVNNGAVTENIVADMLGKSGFDLNYFGKSCMSVDFIIELGGEPVAVEVKSGNNRRAKSLSAIMSDKYKVRRGLLFEKTNVHVDESGVEHYPLFAAAFIRCL